MQNSLLQPQSNHSHNNNVILPFHQSIKQLECLTMVEVTGIEFIICSDKKNLYIFNLHVLAGGGAKQPVVSGKNSDSKEEIMATGAGTGIGTAAETNISSNRSMPSSSSSTSSTLQSSKIPPPQSLPIPLIKSLKAIARNYLLIQTYSNYIGIFQVIYNAQKDPQTHKAIYMVQFREMLKWSPFSSYFIREVMENLIQIQVFFTNYDFAIYQFTNKNKSGVMSFSLNQKGGIKSSYRNKLYGSKCFLNTSRKYVYYLKNFSDNTFKMIPINCNPTHQTTFANSVQNSIVGFFGIQRTENYKVVFAPSYIVMDCLAPHKKHTIQTQKTINLRNLKLQNKLLSSTNINKSQTNPYTSLVQSDEPAQFQFSTFGDLLMVENLEKGEMVIYHIKNEDSEMIGSEDGRWEWFFGAGKKLVGIDRERMVLTYRGDIAIRGGRNDKEKEKYQSKWSESKPVIDRSNDGSTLQSAQLLFSDGGKKQQKVNPPQAQSQIQHYQPYKQQLNNNNTNSPSAKAKANINLDKSPQSSKHQQNISPVASQLQPQAQRKYQEQITAHQPQPQTISPNPKRASTTTAFPTSNISNNLANQIPGSSIGVSDLLTPADYKPKKVLKAKQKQQQQQQKTGYIQQTKTSTTTTKVQQTTTQTNNSCSITSSLQSKENPTSQEYSINLNNDQKSKASKNPLTKKLSPQQLFMQRYQQQQPKNKPQVQAKQQAYQNSNKDQNANKSNNDKTKQQDKVVQLSSSLKESSPLTSTTSTSTTTSSTTTSATVLQSVNESSTSLKVHKENVTNSKIQQSSSACMSSGNFFKKDNNNLNKRSSVMKGTPISTVYPKSRQYIQFLSEDSIDQQDDNNHQPQPQQPQKLSLWKQLTSSGQDWSDVDDDIDDVNDQQQQQQKQQHKQHQKQLSQQQQIQIKQKKQIKQNIDNVKNIINENIYDDDDEKQDNQKNIKEQISSKQSNVVANKQIIDVIISDDGKRGKEQLLLEKQIEKVLNIEKIQKIQKIQKNQKIEQQQLKDSTSSLLQNISKTVYNDKDDKNDKTDEQSNIHDIQKTEPATIQQKQNQQETLYKVNTQQNKKQQQQQQQKQKQQNVKVYSSSVLNLIQQNQPQNQPQPQPIPQSQLLQSTITAQKLLKTPSPLVSVPSSFPYNPFLKSTQQSKSSRTTQSTSSLYSLISSSSNDGNIFKCTSSNTSTVESLFKTNINRNNIFGNISHQQQQQQQKQNSTFIVGVDKSINPTSVATPSTSTTTQQKTTSNSTSSSVLQGLNKRIVGGYQQSIDSSVKPFVPLPLPKFNFLPLKGTVSKDANDETLSKTELSTKKEVIKTGGIFSQNQVINKNISSIKSNNDGIVNENLIGVNNNNNNENNDENEAKTISKPNKQVYKQQLQKPESIIKTLWQPQPQQQVYVSPTPSLKSIAQAFEKSNKEIKNLIEGNGRTIQKEKVTLATQTSSSQIVKKQLLNKTQSQHQTIQQSRQCNQSIATNSTSDKQFVHHSPSVSSSPNSNPNSTSLNHPQMQLIQSHISKFQTILLDSIAKIQTDILKRLDEIPHTHNPYNKNHSLLITEQITQEIIKESQLTLKKWMSSKLIQKIEVSFRQMMEENKNVYDKALEFYTLQAKKKVSSMQLQFDQQSTILNEMQIISANMRAGLQNCIIEGQEMHAYQLKEWRKEMAKVEENVIGPLAKGVDRLANPLKKQEKRKGYDQMITELQSISNMLKEKLEQKQAKKKAKQDRKLQREEKRKAKRLLEEEQIRKRIQIQRKQMKKRKLLETESSVNKHKKKKINIDDEIPVRRERKEKVYYY